MLKVDYDIKITLKWHFFVHENVKDFIIRYARLLWT